MILKDRTAIVTGAGSGIGRAAALIIAREGAVVGVADRSADGANATVEQILAAGGRAKALVFDLTDDQALEGLASFWDNGFRVTGLYEIHGDISSDVPGLRWYVGPGAHIGAYNGTYYHGNYYNSGEVSIGIDGIVGLEYKFNGAPIAVSADLQPYLEFNHPYVDIWGGIGVKYTW